ncbi:MAG: Gfo/Idh/MocA family oxidoreductase [Anaerolineales bacterium]|nr:Gfo/Idh/MocA family oxidoreductase [Anaerolineales bacterium]
MTESHSRLSTRRIDTRSVGFVLAGASEVAARWVADAIRQQPPAPGTQDTAGAWIAGVYSHNERRARQFADVNQLIHFGIDLGPLLQRPGVQCLYVGNHPRHHAETVRIALEAQRHVLCEPPLALDQEEAAELVDLATRRGLVLAMNYTRRALGVIHALHELLIEDRLGELMGGRIQDTAYLIPAKQTWRLQPNGGGVLYDRTLHAVDLLRYLLHTSIEEVYIRSPRRRGYDVEEEVIGFVVLTGGRHIQLHDAFLLPHSPPLIELVGVAGTATAIGIDPGVQQGSLTVVQGDQGRR